MEKSYADNHNERQTTQLIPRRFVAREDFAASSCDAPIINLDAFRADQQAAMELGSRDPFA